MQKNDEMSNRSLWVAAIAPTGYQNVCPIEAIAWTGLSKEIKIYRFWKNGDLIWCVHSMNDCQLYI